MPNLSKRTCRQCGCIFMGGPRAWYCPDCRYERKLIRDRNHKRHGAQRPIGSADQCAICGKKYIVKGGNQKYCPDCANDAVADIDRRQGLEYYRANRDVISRKRKEKRRIPPKTCEICGKLFVTHTRIREMH